MSERKVESVIEAFLQDKGKGKSGDSGNYRSDAERELQKFLSWLRADVTDEDGNTRSDDGQSSPAPTFDQLDERTFRRYARELVSCGYAKSTTNTYFAYVASFCGWAVNEGYLPRHYANTSVARAPLPDNDGRKPGDQQAWTSEQRDLLTRYVDREADKGLDRLGEEDGERDAIRACRDRVVAYILAYTGVRASEVFADPDDERRTGLRWGEVNIEDGSITIFRKKQGWDTAPLPEPVIHPFTIYERVLDPPSDEWPVFPTFHRPTLSELVHDEIEDQDEVAAAREEYGSDLFICRTRDLTPPSLSSNAARRVMRRLCSDADIEIGDGPHDYLAPHGGRRGMGEVLVRQFGYAAAARYLDNSEEMVRKRYSHIEAGKQANQATRALAESDSRVRTSSSEKKE